MADVNTILSKNLRRRDHEKTPKNKTKKQKKTKQKKKLFKKTKFTTDITSISVQSL
jgi:hypothetical protein